MTDGELVDQGPLTPQPDGSMDTAPPIADPDTPRLTADFRGVGGGGVGWVEPTDVGRLVVLALPGGIGGGVAIPVDPTARPGDLHGQLDVLRRRSETAEGPRAVGVTAAILALLLAASSAVWALYKFKPGLIKDQPEPDVPIYAVDEFMDTYRPPTPTPQKPPPTSPGAMSNGMATSTLFHGAAGTTMTGGVNTVSQTALNAANWNNYINELSSLFSTQLAATGSGVAGLMAGAATVTRGTQTELIGAGLGRQLHSNYRFQLLPF